MLFLFHMVQLVGVIQDIILVFGLIPALVSQI